MIKSNTESIVVAKSRTKIWYQHLLFKMHSIEVSKWDHFREGTENWAENI